MQRTDSQDAAAPGPSSSVRTGRHAAPRRVGSLVGRLAGPALIVTAVIAISWDTAVAGLISRQHLDIPAFWVPTHCYLGQSLREGTIPAWNPFVFTGTPFAADPQSGWMFLLPMLMYTVLPCDVAAPLLFLLTPMIGGLGLYLFLRSEGLSRVAGTIGGLVLSLSLAGSKLGLSFPFVSTIAWTAAALWAASCLLRASTWSSRILWTLATAALWGQIVSAHGSQGQLVGTATLAAFLLARTVSDVVRRRRGPGVALALGALLIASVVAVNLATLVPRATVFPRTATSLGNETLDRLTREAADGEGKAVPYKEGRGADPAWPAKLLLPQGAYVGLAVLGLVALAPWTRRHRALALAMGAYGLTAYALSLQDVADAIGERAGGGVALDVLYLHQPWRLAIALVPAVAVLAAVGIDAWSERALEARLAMLGAAGVLVGVTCAWLPDAGSLAPGLLVAGGATLLLLASLRVPLVLAGVAVLVALELSSNVLTGYGLDSQEMLRSNDFGLGLLPPGMTALAGPNLDAGAYLRPPRFVQELGGAADPVRFNVAGPFHDGMMKEENWAAIAEQRSMLFRVEGADGYNPFQLRRFWLYSRHVNTQAQKYNVTSFPDAAAPVLDALGVTHVISPADASPPPDRSPVSTDGRWVLYARSAAAPRAQLFPSWTVVGSADDALDAVTEPGFDPVRTLVLEEDPRVASDPGRETAGTAAYRWDGTQAATIEVNAESPSVLLIRNAYDTAWRATVDGRPVPVLAADSISMGVAVPAGPHTVRLEYRESSIAVGLLGTFTAIVALVSSALWLLRRERRAAPPTVEPEPSHADDSPTTAR